jgi:hypothetical protein
MSSLHHPAFLRIYIGTTTFWAVQNYYQGTTITSDGVDYQYLDFSTGDIVADRSADSGSLQVTLPAITTAVLMVEQGIANGYLGELTIYRFTAETGPAAPPLGQTVLLTFIGEVIGGGSNFDSTVTLELGSALAPLGSQVPSRRFTSELVGIPCRF